MLCLKNSNWNCPSYLRALLFLFIIKITFYFGFDILGLSNDEASNILHDIIAYVVLGLFFFTFFYIYRNEYNFIDVIILILFNNYISQLDMLFFFIQILFFSGMFFTPNHNSFYDPSQAGDPVLFQHVFYFIPSYESLILNLFIPFLLYIIVSKIKAKPIFDTSIFEFNLFCFAKTLIIVLLVSITYFICETILSEHLILEFNLLNVSILISSQIIFILIVDLLINNLKGFVFTNKQILFLAFLSFLMLSTISTFLKTNKITAMTNTSNNYNLENIEKNQDSNGWDLDPWKKDTTSEVKNNYLPAYNMFSNFYLDVNRILILFLLPFIILLSHFFKNHIFKKG